MSARGTGRRGSRSRSRFRSARWRSSTPSGRKCDFLEQWAPANARVLRGRAEEQELDWAGLALAKALAAPPVAAEWCLPLVREGGAAVLWIGESADLDVLARGRSGLRPSLPTRRRGLQCFERPARRLPASRAGPASRASGLCPRPPRPERMDAAENRPEADDVPAPGLCVREPEGRRRQDDDHRQPRGVPRRGRRARARGRPRPAGECHVGPGDEGERHLQLRPPGRGRRRRAREADGVPEPLPDPVEARARRRRRRALTARRTARGSWRPRSPPRRASTSCSSTVRPRSAR